MRPIIGKEQPLQATRERMPDALLHGGQTAESMWAKRMPGNRSSSAQSILSRREMLHALRTYAPRPGAARNMAARSRRPTTMTQWRKPGTEGQVQIDGQAILEPSDLSFKGQVALDLIVFGEEWMRTTGSNAQQAYPTEFSFLGALQEGLHGSSMVLCRRLGLTCNLLALEALTLDELESVLQFERSDQTNSVIRLKALKALARHGIRSEAELHLADEFLMDCGVCREPLFASMTLGDRCAIFNLLEGARSAAEQDPVLQREAAAFAVTLAQSTQEFVAYYSFFMALSGDQEAAPQHAARRARFAEGVVEALTPGLMPWLQCPTFEQPPAAQDVPVLLGAWCAHGNLLGFATLASALAYVAQFARTERITGNTILERASARLRDEHWVWLETFPTAVQHCQDGQGAVYRYDLPDGVRSLHLSGSGSLTVGSYITRHPHDVAGEADL